MKIPCEPWTQEVAIAKGTWNPIDISGAPSVAAHDKLRV